VVITKLSLRDVTTTAKEVATKAKEPKISVLKVIFLIVSIVIVILLETDLLTNVPTFLRVLLYISLFIINIVLGNGLTTMLKNVVNEVTTIIKDENVPTEVKLNKILHVMVQIAYWAGHYFELLNDEQFGDEDDSASL